MRRGTRKRKGEEKDEERWKKVSFTCNLAGSMKFLSGKTTSNLMYRFPFSNGFLYIGIPSPVRQRIAPG